MKKLLLILFAIVLVFGAVFSGCAEPEPTPAPAPAPTPAPAPEPTPAPTPEPTPAPTPEPEESKYGGIIRLVPHSAPTTPLGYPAEADPNSHDLSAPAVESLVKVRDSIVPVLATSWDIADDGKSMTVYLREGVKFHDGSDFNATVAKWNLDNMIEAKQIAKLESVDIIDDYTILLNLSSWDNSIMSVLERDSQMISKAAFEENGIEWARWHPVGTGPFKFVEYERDVRLYYERNDDYWEEGKPYLDGIEWNVIPDETVQKIAFQNGEIHALRASATTAQELRSLGYDYQDIAGGTFALFPDSANPDSPLADRNVRLAISHAIDRETLAEALGYGLANPAYQVYPGFSEAAIDDLDIHEYDPDEARRLLALAGYEEGDISIPIHKFVVVNIDFVIAIANMLGEVGITVEVDDTEPGLFTQMLMGGGWDGALAMAIASGTSLNQWLDFYFSGKGFACTSLEKSDAFMEALQASTSSKSVDPEKIQALMQLMHDEVFIIPFIEEVAIVFFQDGVHDTSMLDYSLDTWTFEDAWLEADLR